MKSISILVILITLILSSIDFYLLKKSGMKIIKCLFSSFLTFIFTFLSYAFFGYMLSVTFGRQYDEIFAIIIILFILAISYFRFKGRQIVKGEIVKKKIKELSIEEKLKNDVSFAVGLGYFFSLFSVIYIFFTFKNDFFGQDLLISLIDPIIFALLAYWGQKNPFYALSIMSIIFIISKLFMISEFYEAGYKQAAGPAIVGMIFFGYKLLKGVYAAALLKYKKL